MSAYRFRKVSASIGKKGLHIETTSEDDEDDRPVCNLTSCRLHPEKAWDVLRRFSFTDTDGNSRDHRQAISEHSADLQGTFAVGGVHSQYGFCSVLN